MNYSRLIHDYLDGELPQQKEDILFREIAANSSIRTDFNLQMKIHMVAKQDLGVIAPPLSITNAVFSQLGFAPPTAISEPSFGEKMYDFTKKNAVWLLLLLFVSTVTTTGYLIYKNHQLANELNNNQKSGIPYVYSEDSDENKNSSTESFNSTSANEHKTNNLIENENGIGNSNFAVANNNQSKSKSNRKNTNFLKNSQSNNFTSDNENENGNISLNDNDENIALQQKNALSASEIKYFSNKYFSSKELNQIAYSRNENGMIIPNFYESLLSLFDYSPLDNSDYSIRIRNLQGFSQNAEFSNLNKNVPFYNDMAIGVYYRVSGNHYLGIEAGVEKFAQKFKLGNGLEYQQNPEMLWAGISYKFTMKDFLIPYILYPYTELTAGATSIGPLFRAQSGLNYSITNRIGLNFALEYNTLYYNVGGTIYNSNKFGLTGGININF